MASLPLILLSHAANVYHRLRKTAYKNMLRQTLDWSPDRTNATKQNRNARPIQLDFSVAKKNRLSWAWRRIGQ